MDPQTVHEIFHDDLTSQAAVRFTRRGDKVEHGQFFVAGAEQFIGLGGIDVAVAGATGAVATALGGEAVDTAVSGRAQQGLTIDSRSLLDGPIGVNEIKLNHQSA